MAREKSPYEVIIDLLENNNINFKLYKHEPVFTSEQAAKVRGDTTVHQGAKALVLQADKKFILFVLPGDTRADLEGLRNYLGAKKLRMASKDSVEAKTGLVVGSIPPFGSVIGLKTYLDQRLLENTEIAFNAARHDRSIRMNSKDYVKVERPQILEF